MICSSDKVMYASQVMFIAVAISDVFAYIHTQKLRSGAAMPAAPKYYIIISENEVFTTLNCELSTVNRELGFRFCLQNQNEKYYSRYQP